MPGEKAIYNSLQACHRWAIGTFCTAVHINKDALCSKQQLQITHVREVDDCGGSLSNDEAFP